MTKKVQELSIENERLRHIVSNCAAALVTGAFISPKATVDFMEGLPKEISAVVSSLRDAAGWEKITSAPTSGEEFIARVSPEFPAFSCFWDGSDFVHYDKDDGFIHYSPREWKPMPSALSTPTSQP